MSLFKTLKDRWSAESPDFFKGVQKVAISLGGSALAVLGCASIPGIIIPAIVTKVCSYIIIAAAAVAGTAKLTKQDP